MDDIISRVGQIDLAGLHRSEQRKSGRLAAEEVHEHLLEQVRVFERQMKADEELGLQLANFGIPAEIHIRNIGYKNPSLIEFTGLIDGTKTVKLVQHVSQLNFLMIAVPAVNEGENGYRVGFKG